MQFLRTLVVDDEPLAHELLEKYIAMTPELELAGHCWDVMDAFRTLHKQPVDLLLLDIKMPDINGIEFLKKLKDAPMVIFTTAYSEYAIESYELNAVDYLLKPFSYERFRKAVNKAMELQFGPKNAITNPTETLNENSAEKTHGINNVLFVRSEGKLIKIELDKLIYVEGLKDYLQLYIGKDRIIIYGTMKNLEDQLKEIPSFLRVNKSYIINIQHITEVAGNVIKLGGISVPIGKTYREKIHSHLNGFKLM
jgi:DNA-binding LytR/AlgR family response regulator